MKNKFYLQQVRRTEQNDIKVDVKLLMSAYNVSQLLITIRLQSV